MTKGLIMLTSEKKIIANRLNGLKSHGPKNTTSTRFNATKHGLLSAGITELDDSEGYSTMLSDLVKEIKPVSTIEMVLVESAVMEIIRLRRARRLEAEYITDVLNPPIYVPDRTPSHPIDPGLPAAMNLESVQPLVSVFQRYEASILQRFFRISHELERLDRMRHGEQLPAPAALDVSVHHQIEVESGTAIPLAQELTLSQEQALGHVGAAVESVSGSLPNREELGNFEDLIRPRE
jgi:hypothetical protein